MIDEELVDRLKIIRAHMGLNQKEFAEAAGIRASSYSELESGKMKCSIEILIILSKTLNVDLHYLCLGDGKIFRGPLVSDFFPGKSCIINSDAMEDFLKHLQKSQLLQLALYSEYKKIMAGDNEPILKEIEAANAPKNRPEEPIDLADLQESSEPVPTPDSPEPEE